MAYLTLILQSTDFSLKSRMIESQFTDVRSTCKLEGKIYHCKVPSLIDTGEVSSTVIIYSIHRWFYSRLCEITNRGGLHKRLSPPLASWQLFCKWKNTIQTLLKRKRQLWISLLIHDSTSAVTAKSIFTSLP